MSTSKQSSAADSGPETAGSGQSHSRSGQPSRRKFKLVDIKDLESLGESEWLIPETIRRGDLVFLYGEPEVGKTFLLLDMMLRLAAGLSWRAEPMQPGDVIYIVAEGLRGLKPRIDAWASQHAGGLDVLKSKVWFLPAAFNIVDEDSFNALVEVLNSLERKPAAIVVETLSRYTVGCEENSAKEMGEFIDRCDELIRRTGAAVIVVHHSGIDSKRVRGSSALRGAADVMLRVYTSRGVSRVESTKTKDSGPIVPIEFKLRVVDLGAERSGRRKTSCHVEYCEAHGSGPSANAPKDDGGAIVRALALSAERSMTSDELRTATGLNEPTFYAQLRKLREAKRVLRDGPRRHFRYSLATATKSELSESDVHGETNSNSTQPGTNGGLEAELRPPLPHRGAGPKLNSGPRSDVAPTADPVRGRSPKRKRRPTGMPGSGGDREGEKAGRTGNAPGGGCDA